MKRILCLLAAILLLSACNLAPAAPNAQTSGVIVAGNSQENTIAEVLHALQNTPTAKPVSSQFLQWGCQNINPNFAGMLLQAINTQGYQDGLFYTLFGKSLFVLHDYFTGEVESNPYIHATQNESGPVTLAFTGDINLADDWEIMPVVNQQPNGAAGCISPDLLAQMQNADVLLVNNEFSFSNRGSPMPGKQYTFRASTANVEILKTLGVDIVSLANNHVYDYGAEAFEDTLATLGSAQISYVGAGHNLAEAMQAQYFIAGGIKIAYVAASRAEKYILTPEATATQAGVLRTYDPTLFLQAIQTARQNADVVIAYPHWGTENTHILENAQIELAKQLVDAGVDIVVGAHPHCLQGIDFYNGKPIAYSLGNFWFNTRTTDTALLEITLNSPTEYALRLLPCLQKGGKTFLLTEEADRERIFTHMENISSHIQIDHDGVISYAE